MGFWSSLGKVAGIAGGVLAAPLTFGTSIPAVLASAGLGVIGGGTAGGKLSSILDSAGKVGNAIGQNGANPAAAVEIGRQQGRMTDAELQMARDRIAQQQYATDVTANNAKNTFGLGRYNAGLNAADVDLARRKFQLSAPGQRASNAVRGDILSNAQDVNINAPGIRIPTVSGGLRPSMFSANTRALGSQMSADALAGQQKGDTFDPLAPLPDYSAAPAAPGVSNLPQPNALDTALTSAGYFGALEPAFADILNKYKRSPQPPPGYTEPSFDAGFG